MFVMTGEFADYLRTEVATPAHSLWQRVVRFVALVLGLLFALGGAINANAAGYTVSITTAYPQITIPSTSPQVVWTKSTNSCTVPSAYKRCDDGTSQNMPIGFTFKFAGTNYSRWSMSTNGVIFFETASSGNSTGSGQWVPSNLPTTALSSPTGTVIPALMPFWADLWKAASANNVLDANSASQPADASFYQYAMVTSGSASVLVIQLRNVGYYNATGTLVNLQVQLWSTGQIVYSYGNMEVMTSNPLLRIGLQYPGGGCNTLANNQSASLSNQSYVFIWDSAAATCPTPPTINHYEIRKGDTATLCPNPVSVLACSVATKPCPAASIINNPGNATRIINASVLVTGTGTSSVSTPAILPISFNLAPAPGFPIEPVTLTWASGSVGTATLSIQASITPTNTSAVCINAAGTTVATDCNIAVSNTTCGAAAPNHFQIVGPANSACGASNTFTVKAWADTAETTPYTSALVTGTVTQSGNLASLPNSGVFNMAVGVSSATMTPISFPAAGITTFGTIATGVTGATTCLFGSATSCAFTSASCAADMNCTETVANAASAADSDSQSGQLYTKLAGTTFSFDVMARKVDNTVNTTYASDGAKTVTVELVDGTNPASCAAYPQLSPAVASQTLTFATAVSPTAPPDAGRKTISFTVPNAYKNVLCRATDNATPALQGCSTDAFSIRPQSVTLNTTPTMATPPSAAATPVVKAGGNFTLQAAANPATATNYNGTLTQVPANLWPQDPAEVTQTAQCGSSPLVACVGTLGVLTPSTLVAGSAAVNAIYSEVGYLYLAAGAYTDNTWTEVDGTTDCIAGSTSIILSSGKYGCNIGNASTVSLGRFIPDHFETAIVAGALPTRPIGCPSGLTCPINASGSNGLVYSNQPFTVQVIAKNGAATPAVTQNYSGNFARTTNLTAYSTKGGGTQNPGSGYFCTAQLGTGAVPAVASAVFDNGSGSITNPLYTLDRTLCSVVGTTPVTGPSDIFIRAVENAGDGVSSLQATAANSVEAGLKIASGRINIPNLIGSEKLGLCVPATVQYYTGASWTTSLTDSATTFGTNLTTDTTTGHVFLVSGTTLVTTGTTPVGCPAPTPASASVAVTNGVRRFRVASSGVTGKSLVQINSPAYLPSTGGTLFWGAYKSPVIDIREVFR